ncbi:TPA: glycosyltransferase family 2 protein [Klebsiella pneumoniae]|nr:glycosyltransferase family 2 protein [Klebsiella pneumoniae]
MNNEMTVAVIVPVYNGMYTIERAIASVQKQTYTKWHLYVINDASTDNTLNILKKYDKEPKVTIINLKRNAGAANARNEAIKLSEEKYIAFLDADDEWHDNKLSMQMDSIVNDNVNVVCSFYNYIKGETCVTISTKLRYLSMDDFLKKKFRVCFSSLIFKRPKENILFNNMGHEDFYFIYLLLKEYNLLSVLRQSVVNYYEVSGSLSRNKQKAAGWYYKILTKIFNGEKLKVSIYYIYYVLNGIRFTLQVKRK